MSLIITKGFGDDIIIEYVSVPVCSPEVTSHEWGKKSMKAELYSITPRVVVVPDGE